MNEKYSEREKELVVEMMEWSESTSELKLAFGYTGKDGHCYKGIVIESCAPIIIQKLIEKGCILNLEDGKLHVTIFK